MASCRGLAEMPSSNDSSNLLLLAVLDQASDAGDPGVSASPYQSLKKGSLCAKLTRDKFPNECLASVTSST